MAKVKYAPNNRLSRAEQVARGFIDEAKGVITEKGKQAFNRDAYERQVRAEARFAAEARRAEKGLPTRYTAQQARDFAAGAAKSKRALADALKKSGGSFAKGVLSPAALAEGVAGSAAKAATHERFKREARAESKPTRGGMKRVKTKA